MKVDAIENRPLFLRTVWKRNGYLILLVALEALVLYVLAHLRFDTNEPDREKQLDLVFYTQFLGYYVVFHRVSWLTMTWVGIFLVLQVAAAEYTFFAGLDGEGMISLYPEDKSEGQRFGELTGPEIVQVVQELAREFDVRKIDRIVVTRQPDPNAFTAHAFGLWNAVVLHSNLLEVLPRKGVRSVIAHELGHVRRWDSMVYQLVKLPTAFAWIIALLAFLHMAGGLFHGDVWTRLQRLVFIVVAFGVTVWAFKLLGRVANLASQQTELIADSYAAQVAGWLPHLNALLLIGERAQALTVLGEALKELPAKLEEQMSEKTMLRLLNRFPPRELNKAVARESAARLFIQDRLEQLKTVLHVPLTDQEIATLAEGGAKALDNERQAEAAKAKAQGGDKAAATNTEERALRTDWRNFDWDASGYLDAREVAALVKELRQNPDQMLFRQFLGEDAEWQSHPTMRRRILHLHELFAPEREIVGGKG
jgi:Zn-dependent protease with chaperone function